MERRKIIGAAMFSAAIAGGGIAGVVLGNPASSSAATASGGSTTTSPGDRPSHGMGRGLGHGDLGLDAAAKAIGITTDALRSQLEAGKTIAQVAKAHGVDVQKVIDAMVADAKTKLEANLEKIITDRVNGTFERPDGPGGPDGPQRGFGFRGGFGLDVAAKAIGVSTQSLLSDLKSGKSIADVAKANGVSVQKVIDAMVASMKTELDSQVKAGRLTADQAAKIKANLTKMITDQVNGTFARPNLHGMPSGPGGPGGFGGATTDAPTV
jgi:uncharacterized protein (DUF433 family)